MECLKLKRVKQGSRCTSVETDCWLQHADRSEVELVREAFLKSLIHSFIRWIFFESFRIRSHILILFTVSYIGYCVLFPVKIYFFRKLYQIKNINSTPPPPRTTLTSSVCVFNVNVICVGCQHDSSLTWRSI